MSSDVLLGFVSFLPAVLIAFLTSVLLLWNLQGWAVKYIPKRVVEKERIGLKYEKVRFGGIILVIAFWFGIIFWSGFSLSPTILALLVGSILIVPFGILDDIRPIPWWVQLLFQFLLGIVLISLGLRIEMMQSPLGGAIDFRNWIIPGVPVLALLIWLILVINAVNWLDGLDGLLGSVSCIGLATLALVSLFPEVGQPGLAAPALILLGATGAFLVFNWPPARLIAGTGGAYFLGFALAVLAVSAGAKVATTTLVLIIPILDALFVLWQRYREGASLFAPDGRHLHYRLIELGWSEKNILLFYTSLTLGMALLALTTDAFYKLIVLVVGVMVLGIFSLGLHKWQQSLR
jgi:UDP-GlcNAc:undecaprenyl-phosphate GlcNAc-1-phosphate transferase